ncbi:MAG: hypothetical protein ACO3UU_06235, partial [Minisyncoccia bacterium]
SRSTSGGIHTQTTPVYFLSNSFTVNKSTSYFESKVNDKVYYNPTKSVGIGTTPGTGINVNYNIGITTYSTFIPTQSIFIPNHPFKTGQQVIFRKPSGADPISVSDTSTSASFNILSGDSETLYTINKSKDYIGLVTSVGFTTNTNGLFFRNTSWSAANDNYQYSIESNFEQIKVDVNKINAVVSVSTSHQLEVGDTVFLNVSPDLSVGIGTSTAVRVKRSSLIDNIIINPIGFSSSGISTETNQITISSHGLKTGDKILYQSESIPSGIETGTYYVYKVDDNTIKLSETYLEVSSVSPSPSFVNLITTGIGTQEISLVNPQIQTVKNNNLVFDLSDSSLSGYELKIYYDKDFRKEFVSVATTNSLSVSGFGTAGVSTNASLTLNYTDSVPEKLYYNLEKSGYISTADTDVVNYSELSFVDSVYNGNYTVVSVGDTTFTVSLTNNPENLNYKKEECDVLEYSSNSTSITGGIGEVNLISGGYGYKSLPRFVGSNSASGEGAYIVPSSDSIGKITQSRIINEGFEYASDKTLRPTATIPQSVYISSSNTIDTITIINGGQNYTSAPDLILVNSDTGELIDSGFLKANLTGSSVGAVEIEVEPKGLPIKPVTIRAINNSNSVSIDRVESSSSGIVTCILTTPIAGFTSAPFAVGDRIFVEGIEKTDSSGDGFNSENYGYRFFTVENYFGLNPDKLEFSVSGLTTNPGIAKTIHMHLLQIIKVIPSLKLCKSFYHLPLVNL